MSFIANILDSIDISLLNEIGANPSASQIAASFSTDFAATAGGPSSDSIDFSQAAELVHQLQQLQATVPAEFAKVTAYAASQLRQAAQQSNDPSQVRLLSTLADTFQQASQSGDLSLLEGGAPPNGPFGNGNPSPPDQGNGQDFLANLLTGGTQLPPAGNSGP